MYTNNNNSNNDKDGEEKRFTPLMIKKKQWASKPSSSPQKKIRIRQGFESGNFGNQVNSIVNL